MTTVYLIRHTEAEGNLYRRMQGQYEGSVTERGRRQIEALGRRFASVRLDAVYSSDMCRTMETAAVLCRQKGLPLYVDARLKEVNMGPWEDMPFGTAAAEHPEEMERFAQTPAEWYVPGAETQRDVADRCVPAFREIAKRHPDQTVAVVAHGFVIRVLLDILFGQGQKMGNTAVNCMTYEQGNWDLKYTADVSHLEETPQKPWLKVQDLWIRPMAPDAVEEYIRYRKDAWQVVYGNLKGFDGGGFWLDAQRTMGDDPEAMVVGYLEGRPVGMIQMSPERDAKKGVGYIPFLYLREEFRNRGLAVQLVGHAASFYRKLGRTKLQLSVAPENAHGMAFYEKYGFRRVKKHPGKFGYLWLMEKDIAPPKKPTDIQVIEV